MSYRSEKCCSILILTSVLFVPFMSFCNSSSDNETIDATFLDSNIDTGFGNASEADASNASEPDDGRIASNQCEAPLDCSTDYCLPYTPYDVLRCSQYSPFAVFEGSCENGKYLCRRDETSPTIHTYYWDSETLELVGEESCSDNTGETCPFNSEIDSMCATIGTIPCWCEEGSYPCEEVGSQNSECLEAIQSYEQLCQNALSQADGKMLDQSGHCSLACDTDSDCEIISFFEFMDMDCPLHVGSSFEAFIDQAVVIDYRSAMDGIRDACRSVGQECAGFVPDIGICDPETKKCRTKDWCPDQECINSSPYKDEC